jgi:hypothetical protein
MATVLLKTETNLKHFPKIDFASAVKLLKISPKRTEWDTSQSAPRKEKNLKNISNQCTCGHLVNFCMFLSS